MEFFLFIEDLPDLKLVYFLLLFGISLRSSLRIKFTCLLWSGMHRTDHGGTLRHMLSFTA